MVGAGLVSLACDPAAAAVEPPHTYRDSKPASTEERMQPWSPREGTPTCRNPSSHVHAPVALMAMLRCGQPTQV